MRKGENMSDDISFDGVDGLKAPEFLQALRNKAFGENKSDDTKYMVSLAALCFAGPALEWFENLADDVQADWSLLRRALLARFPASGPGQKETPTRDLIFTGNKPADCEDFVRNVRKHSHMERKSDDDKWMAQYAAGCMAGEALKWHAKLDAHTRGSWTQLERALLAYFPEPPPCGLTPAGRVLVEGRESMQAPSFLPTSEQAWLKDAKQRRAAYEKAGPGSLSSVHWLLVQPGEAIPDNAIQTGLEENFYPLYSLRTWHEGGLHPGKVVRNTVPGPYIPFRGKELHVVKPYEVLVGDASAVRWVSNPWNPVGGLNAGPVQMKSFNAVEGGRDVDGTALFVVQAFLEGKCGWQPGKVAACGRGCEMGWYDKVYVMPHFRILVWAE